MRHTFFTSDPVVEKIMDELSGLLKQWGLRGSSNEVVRYALHYAAEGHGFKKRSPERRFTDESNTRKGVDDGGHPDGSDRPGIEDDGSP